MTGLLDELEPGFERSLLEAAREDGPSRDARRRALACGLAVATGAPDVAAGARARSDLLSRMSAKVAWKTVGLASVAVSLAGPAIPAPAPDVQRQPAPADERARGVATAPPTIAFPSTAASEVPTASVSASSARRLGVESRRLSDGRGTPQDPPSAPPAPTRLHPASSSPPTIATTCPTHDAEHDRARSESRCGPAEPSDSLDDEIALIDAARVALAHGHGGDARKVLEIYAARYPRGALAMEASLLRLESLIRAGNRAEAERLARAIDATGSGPYAARIRALMSEPTAPR